jgi:hypothetical protein
MASLSIILESDIIKKNRSFCAILSCIHTMKTQT